jgi:hypothetical protein
MACGVGPGPPSTQAGGGRSPRLWASPSATALVAGRSDSSVSSSRLWPLGSGSVVIVTTAPIRAKKPTMALVSTNPILGNKLVSA